MIIYGNEKKKEEKEQTFLLKYIVLKLYILRITLFSDFSKVLI